MRVYKVNLVRKSVWIVFNPKGHPDQKMRTYVTLDDQILANQISVSLARSLIFDMFGIQSEAFPYTLKKCSGCIYTPKRRVTGFMVESADGNFTYLYQPCNLIQ